MATEGAMASKDDDGQNSFADLEKKALTIVLYSST